PETAKLAQTIIARFAVSDRAAQISNAKTLFREIEFLLPWPLDRTSTTQYFRGYIDCLYQDAAGIWRIVDYKTTDVKPAGAKTIAQRYDLQLYVYSLAAERALGTAPTELVLELLRPGIEHIIPWNEKTRAAAIEQIDSALTTTNASTLLE